MNLQSEMNPFYLVEAKAPGYDAPWATHVAFNNSKHHDKMSAWHADQMEKHSNLAVKHDENSTSAYQRAAELSSHNSPKSGFGEQIKNHMAKATEHMMLAHQHNMLEKYHDHMQHAHSLMHEGMEVGNSKRIHQAHAAAAQGAALFAGATKRK